MTRSELKTHIETLEKAYEFFLSYAALGAKQEDASRVGGQLRAFLAGAADALQAVAQGAPLLLDSEDVQPADTYRDMLAVVASDATRAEAAVRIVLVQETISSQLVDSLNASSHMRTILTDLFLLDDVL